MGQLDIEPEMAGRVSATIKQAIMARLHMCEETFRTAPYASVWTVLQTLAQSYGEDGQTVYEPIGQALGLDLVPQGNRERFKIAYRSACSRVGLRLQDYTHPTGLFFSNVGVADAQTGPLAECLLRGVLRLGPPPEEDLSELRQWQRLSTREGLDAYKRMRTALANDNTAYYAQLFCNWRAGEHAGNAAGKTLFSELDRHSKAMGLTRSRLVASPHLMWTSSGLALLATPSAKHQIIKYEGVPYQITPGVPWTIPTPWPKALSWSSGGVNRSLSIRPEEDEVFIFALDTQRLVERLSWSEEGVAAPSREIFILSSRSFKVEDGSRDMESVQQDDMHVALAEIDDGGIVIRSGEDELRVERERDPGIRAEGPIMGRCGSLPLYASSGEIVVTSGAESSEAGRLLRVKFGGSVWFKENVSFDRDGRARISFAELDIPARADPDCLEVALLVKGADKKPGARAEIMARFFVWPGTDDFDASESFKVDVVPSNFLPNTSENLHHDSAGMWIDPSHGFRRAVLSLEIEGKTRDFEIPVRGTRLFRHMVSTERSSPVSLGSIVVLGHADRNDTLIVKSTERWADLYVRGTTIRRPFIGRSQWEISARQIDPEEPKDDQIALVFDNGRRDLLCRISKPVEPHRVEIKQGSEAIEALIEMPVRCDAIGLEIFGENRSDGPRVARVPLSGAPVDMAAPDWLRASVLSFDPQLVKIEIVRAAWEKEAAVGLIEVRESGSDHFYRLEDSQGRSFGLPLIARGCAAVTGRPDAAASALSRVMATRFQPHCDSIIRDELASRLHEIVSGVAARGLYSPILPLAFAAPLHGTGRFLSRLDLLDEGMAPEMFSAEPSAFSCLSGNPRARHLSRLPRGATIEVPEIIEQHSDMDELLSIWLKHIGNDGNRAPQEIGAESLRHAFIAYRQNAQSSDFMLCLQHETVGQTLKLILDRYSSSSADLLAFDDAAGTDRTGVKLASYLSSFARAARSGRASAFHGSVARRVGLPVSHVTPATSLSLQVAGELFAYFMMFWTLVERSLKDRKGRG